MKQLDNGWWRSDEGYIRAVTITINGSRKMDAFVSWRHMCPAAGYFSSWEQAYNAMMSQPLDQPWGKS